jgi:hypothetical protein
MFCDRCPCQVARQKQWEELRVNEFPAQAGSGKRASTLATRNEFVANGVVPELNPPALRVLTS